MLFSTGNVEHTAFYVPSGLFVPVILCGAAMGRLFGELVLLGISKWHMVRSRNVCTYWSGFFARYVYEVFCGAVV